MISFNQPPKQQDLFTSTLHDEKTFYPSFLQDLKSCDKEVIIESPFVTTWRMKLFWPIFKVLLEKDVKITIFTRPPEDHDDTYRYQAEQTIQECEEMGIQVLLCVGNHHRKLAIIDRQILWEGSLNILSQTNSREIMRRIDSQVLSDEIFNFLELGRFI